MGSLNNYLENAVLNVVFGQATYTSPTVYIGLATAAISEDDTGTTLAVATIEPSGGNYARAVTSAASWASAATGLATLSVATTFQSATASWGTITHFFLATAANSLANILAFGSVATAKTVASDDIVTFGDGSIVMTLS